jgi:hypothetical protein
MSKNNPNQNSTEHYHKGSCVEFFLSKGIPSRNTTHEHLGETSLIFIQSPKKETIEPLKDDSVETMIRNLNRRK